MCAVVVSISVLERRAVGLVVVLSERVVSDARMRVGKRSAAVFTVLIWGHKCKKGRACEAEWAASKRWGWVGAALLCREQCQYLADVRTEQTR